jgi:two-component system response regulator DevR
LTRVPLGNSPVRVVVLDDNTMVRRRLRELLSCTDDLVFAGEAATAADAVREIERVLPDVAVVNVELPDGSGIDLCRQVRSRHLGVNCLLRTFHDDEDALLAAVVAGAWGHLTAQTPQHCDPGPHPRAAARETLTPPEVTRQLLEQLRGIAELNQSTHRPNRCGLDRRERQVLDHLTNGATNAEIAFHLSITETAVPNQVAMIFVKLSLARHIWLRRLPAPSQGLDHPLR